MFYGVLMSQGPPAGSINLQATLSAATANSQTVVPHHPIACAASDLLLHDDGSLECGHARTDDDRVQACVDASVAILLFELVYERFGSTPRVETST